MSLKNQAARLTNMVVRGVVSGMSGRLSNASTFAGEAQGDVKVAQPAGFSSNAGNMDAILLAVNGHASKRVAVVVMDGTDVQAEAGQVIVYAPNNPEHRITLSSDGITLSTTNLKVEADNFTWKDKRVVVEGDKDTDGDTIL